MRDRCEEFVLETIGSFSSLARFTFTSQQFFALTLRRVQRPHYTSFEGREKPATPAAIRVPYDTTLRSGVTFRASR